MLMIVMQKHNIWNDYIHSFLTCTICYNYMHLKGNAIMTRAENFVTEQMKKEKVELAAGPKFSAL
jgi:hypothetical protein